MEQKNHLNQVIKNYKKIQEVNQLNSILFYLIEDIKNIIKIQNSTAF